MRKTHSILDAIITIKKNKAGKGARALHRGIIEKVTFEQRLKRKREFVTWMIKGSCLFWRKNPKGKSKRRGQWRNSPD